MMITHNEEIAQMATGSYVSRMERSRAEMRAERAVNSMRKVRNKKVIDKISYKSFRANRTRNVIAIIAIALTAMLFTTLFTVGIGTAENFQRQTMRQAGGDSHGVFKNITEEQYEKLSRHPLVKESADNRLVANTVENPEFLKRHMEIWYYPKNFYGHHFIEIIDGKAPEKAEEYWSMKHR